MRASGASLPLLAAAARRLALPSAAAALLAAAQEGQLLEVVVPSSAATVETGSGNRYPFGDDVPRYQQAHRADELAALLGAQIQEIAFRMDSGSVVPTPGFQYGNVRLRLSTGEALVDQLSTDMDQNLGPDVAVVYDGPFAIPPMTGGGGPNPFDFRFVLTAPFVYAGGDLLLDVEIAGPYTSTYWYLDAPDVAGDAVSRAWLKGGSTSADSQAFVVELVAVGGTAAVDPMVDCGGNAGLLSHVDGSPALGQVLKLAMHAGQTPGVIGYLAFALVPAPGWPPCGLALPGAGELLLDPAPPTPVMLLGGGATWSGAPLVFQFPIPDDPDLISVDVFAQGLWLDALGLAPAEPLRLTTGLALEIGL